MFAITLEEAQAHLADWIDKLAPGEELIVTRDDQPVAKLARAPRASWPCKAGSAKDQILWIAPDFDAPLDDFREYME
jgi:antitoxin (DNA-binding transcriptional repressor) of toxin-antitoxin stability system